MIPFRLRRRASRARGPGRPRRPAGSGRRRRLGATRLLVVSFLGLIAVGTAGLLVLPGLYAGPRLGLVDALFTATSAVCVTGLIVVDTATYFTPAGQAWIALLIQLGGLGILTLTTLLITALGRRAALAAEEAAGGEAIALLRVDAPTLLRSIVAFTLGIELAGGVLLWIVWRGELGSTGALWPAAFHAISAFCNAGFSVFSDSLVRFRGSPATLLVASALIVTGGLGFLVIEDLRGHRFRTGRFTLHTRFALAATAILLAGGTLLYLSFELAHGLRGMGWRDRIVNAWFMSVTARTAGFNTVDYASASNPSLFLTLLLMIVGGSPGSTAGGLKTTTFVLLGLLFWSRLRGERNVSAFGRTVPEETVERATGLVVGGLVVLACAVFLLIAVEAPSGMALDREQFVRLVFEAHSAFGTVGLSMGATPELTPFGRLVVVFLMFLGRVGPLSLAASMALAPFRRRIDYRYAREDVVVG